jgi:amino acid adenylation domain-containing protein
MATFRTVPDLVTEVWSSRAEDAAVIESTGRVATGTELLGAVDRWTTAFGEAGVSRGDRVGIALPRSIDQVAAVLAAMRVGAPYVPLDPSYPAARREFVVRDAGLRVAAGTAPAGIGDDTVRRWISGDASSRGATRAPAIDPDEDAYVIYTSGSSGMPKGVRISHRNLDTFLHEWDSLVDPTRRGVWLASTSLSFDPSVVEIIWTLARGWQVVLAPDRPAAGVLGSLIAAHGVTHLQCTPTRASMLLTESIDRNGLESLEHLLIGGEVLTAAMARELRSLVPRVTNIYGPTETTVWAFAHDIAADGELASITDPVPIGRPLPGIDAFVIEPGTAREVSAGAEGEIVLAGDDVSIGYHDRDERTASQFVSVMVGGVERRVYRTGDLGQQGTDGVWVYRGRIDDQIKISGHRIEPAEIESVLHTAGIERAAVVVRTLASGVPRLVAFVQSSPGTTIDVQHLRALCVAELPASHVPRLFVQLDEFPLTPSGKIDRRALPTPESEDPGDIDLETPAEVASVCRIWSSVLGVAVRPDDDFFALGGDSLAAVAILAEVARVHGEALGLASLVDAPTPRLLVDELHRGIGQTRSLVPIRPAAGRPRARLVLVHGAGGNVVNLVPMAKLLPADIDVVALQAYAVTRPGAAMDTTVEAMASRYVRELDVLPDDGASLVVGGYSDGGTIAWEMAQQLIAAGRRPSRVLLIDSAIGVPALQVPVHERLLNVVRNVRDRQRGLGAFVRESWIAQRTADDETEPTARDTARLPTIDVQNEVEAAVERYVVQPIDVDVALIRASHTRIAVWSDFRWKRYVRRSFRICFAPGSHLGITSRGNAPALAEAVRQQLS